MRLMVAVVVCLVLSLRGGSALHAQSMVTNIAPDAAIVAEPLFFGGETIAGISKQVGTVFERRAWADFMRPLDDWGAGLSVDLSPGDPACIGIGYLDGWQVYLGAHLAL